MAEKLEISDNSFVGNDTITSAKFGNKCYVVGENAFKDCDLLKEVNEDNVIECIESNAFSNSSLQSAKFNNLKKLYPNAFDSCKKLSFIDIPNCNNIPEKSFQDCINLNRVNIDNKIESQTEIHSDAFYNCEKLSEINFDNCISIGNGSFLNCKSLSRANINKCEEIGDFAFMGCEKLSQLSISSCLKMGKDAFVNCENLKKVYIYNSLENFCHLEDKYAFCIKDNVEGYKINPNTLFYFKVDNDKDIIGTYKEDENWKFYSDNMLIMVQNNQILYTSKDNTIEELNSEIDIDEHNYHNEKSNYGLIQFKTEIKDLNFKIFTNDSKINITSIDIPSECVAIGNEVFDGYTNLTDIELSKTLTTIGDYAFKDCIGLKYFTIPNSIENLGEGVFSGCKNIEKFEGKFVTYNGKAIVYNQKLICVLPKDDIVTEGRIYNISEIDSNIKYLGKSCFCGCEKLIRVNIPSSVEYIAENSFEKCNNLREIHFESANPCELIGDAFGDINQRLDFKIFVPQEYLSNYKSKWIDYSHYIYPKAEDNTIIYCADKKISNKHYEITCGNEKYYIIKNISNQTIPSLYLSGKDINTVIIGENITKIGIGAFKNCEKLNYIYLPDSIIELNNQCFYGCKSLKRIHIPSGLKNPKEYIPVNITSNSSSLIVGVIGDSLKFKNTGTNINFGKEVFRGCENLKEFGSYIKGHVTEDNRCYIDDYYTLNFFAQKDKDKYTIPNDIKTIGEYAFADFNGSVNFGFSSSVEVISKCAFINCTNFREISLPNELKIISDYSFDGCKNMRLNSIPENVTQIGESAFRNCKELGKISLPNKLKIISDYAFDGCTNMWLKSIPENVTQIGEASFRNCFCNENLNETIDLDLSNITNINKNIFYNCKKINKVKINSDITTINSGAFSGCTNLKSISYTNNTSKLNSINSGAFSGCTNLNMTIPDSVTYIGDYAFSGCETYNNENNVLKINNINTMGQYCFSGSDIKKLQISEKCLLSSIPIGAFSDCKSLTNIEIKSTTIKTIENSAFSGCVNLCLQQETLLPNSTVKNINLELPDSIITIEDNVFNGCINVLHVDLPKNLYRLGNNCFNTGTNNTKIYTYKLSKIPIFTINGNGTSSFSNNSYPFGEVSSYSPIIYVGQNSYKNYIQNIHWKKYYSIIKTGGYDYNIKDDIFANPDSQLKN